MEKIIKINQLPIKVLLLIGINDLLDTTGQLLMKMGIHHLTHFPATEFFQFWIGFLIYLFNFFLWMKILSKIDLSVALPLASTSYILIPFAAVFFLHEHVPTTRWLGLVLIVLGIFFVSQHKSSRGAA